MQKYIYSQGHDIMVSINTKDVVTASVWTEGEKVFERSIELSKEVILDHLCLDEEEGVITGKWAYPEAQFKMEYDKIKELNAQLQGVLKKQVEVCHEMAALRKLFAGQEIITNEPTRGVEDNCWVGLKNPATAPAWAVRRFLQEMVGYYDSCGEYGEHSFARSIQFVRTGNYAAETVAAVEADPGYLGSEDCPVNYRVGMTWLDE